MKINTKNTFLDHRYEVNYKLLLDSQIIDQLFRSGAYKIPKGLTRKIVVADIAKVMTFADLHSSYKERLEPYRKYLEYIKKEQNLLEKIDRKFVSIAGLDDAKHSLRVRNFVVGCLISFYELFKKDIDNLSLVLIRIKLFNYFGMKNLDLMNILAELYLLKTKGSAFVALNRGEKTRLIKRAVFKITKDYSRIVKKVKAHGGNIPNPAKRKDADACIRLFNALVYTQTYFETRLLLFNQKEEEIIKVYVDGLSKNPSNQINKEEIMKQIRQDLKHFRS